MKITRIVIFAIIPMAAGALLWNAKAPAEKTALKSKVSKRPEIASAPLRESEHQQDFEAKLKAAIGRLRGSVHERDTSPIWTEIGEIIEACCGKDARAALNYVYSVPQFPQRNRAIAVALSFVC